MGRLILSDRHFLAKYVGAEGSTGRSGGGAPDLGFRPSAEGRRGSRVRGGGERGPETGEQEAEQRAPPHFLLLQEEIQNFEEEIQKKFK